METTETRRVGKHLFIFEKANGNASSEDGGKSRTLIASCVNNYDEKLPREFVKYMRTLFDILDERRSGFVKLSDIEARWGRKSVHFAAAEPSDVLENLRKVAPSNGLLSFEKLCLGFQLALRPSGGKKEEAKKVTVQEPLNDSRREVGREKLRSREGSKKGDKTKTDHKNELSLPFSKQHHRRPRSMVQLRQQKELDLSVAKRKGGILEGLQKTDKKTVIDKLRQWQKDTMRKATGNTNIVKETERTDLNSKPSSKAGKGGDNAEHRSAKLHSTNKDLAHAKLPCVRVYYQGEKPNGLNGGSRDSTTCSVVHVKDSVNKTVVSKEAKLKDLEEELKVLGEGLSTVEEVRDWLFTRITAIQEEKLYVKSVERYSSQDYEAMVHLMRRKELGLTSSSFKTFPKHMDELKSHFHQILQKPAPESSSAHESSDFESKRKIAQLEKEKSALIRELFQYKPKKPMVCVK